MSSKKHAPETPQAVQQMIIEHLNRRRSQLIDKNDSLKAAGIRLSGGEGMPQGAMVLELLGDGRAAEDSADESEKREKASSMIKGIFDSVQADGERIVVVNVNTPAVDLQRDFAPDEIDFMRDDIFRDIRSQLGAELEPGVEESWARAFGAIMDIVKYEKNRK